MPLDFLKKLFAGKNPPPPPRKLTVAERIAEDAERFSASVKARTGKSPDGTPGTTGLIDEALEAERKGAKPTEEQLSACASYLGEIVRKKHGGRWVDDDLLGLVLQDMNTVPYVSFVPLAMAQKKWELGEGLKIARFFETLDERLDQENQYLMYLQSPTDTMEKIAVDLMAAEKPNDSARAAAERFRKFWQDRFKQPIPLTLQGAREAERFLRSHFFLFALHQETLVRMGFFLGEIARGLHEGEWDYTEVRDTHDPARAALRWPELPYYPVGRVMKLVTEQPETETFDEYIRLVPSARKELRAKDA